MSGGDDGFFEQGVGGASQDAGAAGNAFGFHKGLVARGNEGGEAAAVDGEREGALHFFAGADAARAHDAFGLIKFEVGVRVVDVVVLVILALVAVANFCQADGGEHLLEFGGAAGGAFEHFARIVGRVQLHHALAKFFELRGLRENLHAIFARGGAGRGISAATFYFHEAEAAGTEGFKTVGSAELGNRNAGLGGSAKHGSACRNGDGLAVDFNCDEIFRHALGRAVVRVEVQRHDGTSELRPAACGGGGGAGLSKSSGKLRTALCTG